MKQTVQRTKQEVIDKIKELYNKYGKINWRTFVDEGYPQSQWREHGKFNELLIEAGVTEVSEKSISKEDLMADVILIKDKLGRLTKDLYIEHGKYSRKPINRLFGSWNNMLKELGLEVNCEINISEENLLQELKDLYAEYDAISATVVKTYGKYSVEVYQRRFGSINEALTKAGLPTQTIGGDSPIAQSVFKKITDILGEKPVLEQSFEWLRNDRTGRRLFIDAYYPEHNIAVEYNGPQHYMAVPHYQDTHDDFERRRYRDEIKYKLLENNGVKLLVIKYNDKVDRDALIKRIAPLI